ncbi:MAG: pyridoxal-phosphate dependent enzyme [Acidimicrobiales bacterium]
MASGPGLTVDDIEAAAARLAGRARVTPVLTSRQLDEAVAPGAKVFVKAESFQRTGSFKFRGAYNAVACLSPAERAGGVVTGSSGNHAAALACAAAIFGVPAVIVMPEDAPAGKLAATRGYGAEVVPYDRYREDRETLVAELAAARGLTVVPPYDHWPVMAGQGTVALELFAEVGELDVLLVCCGGGGLLAGCAAVARSRQPDVRIYGVEPAAGDDTKRSLDAGRRVEIEVPRTIADGQQLTAPGALTFEVNRRLVDDVLLVDDAEIVAAMRFLFERMKVVAEPSGASALAAALTRKADLAGARVGVTFSGGNIDAARFAALMAP